MNLTIEQKDFFEHHKIDKSLVFDATGTGLVGKELKEAMHNSDTLFAIGTNKCGNLHGIKTRSGHCPVCDTQRIAHTLRSIKKEAYVYVVVSKKGELIKVGFTKDLEDRLFHLNKDSYGGSNDWLFLFHARYKNAGEVELELHNRLKDYNFGVIYNHYGKDIRCYELFKCSYKKIKETIDFYNNSVIGIDNIKEVFEFKNAENLYDFSEEINTERRVGNIKNNGEKINNIHEEVYKKNNYNEFKNQELKENKVIVKKEDYKESYLEKGTGEYITKENDYYGSMVFYSQIEINGIEYGIFKDENKCGIFRLDNGEIIGEKFDECGKIIEVEGKYFLNVKKDNKWKILNVITGDFLYGDFDYAYEIDFTGVVKVKKDGIWKVLGLESGEFDNKLFDVYFEPIEINNNKYIKVIDGYVDLSTGKYVGGTFDRVRNIQSIGNKNYFCVFKDISDEESLCGIVNVEGGKLVGGWFELLDFNIDEYLDENLEDDDIKVITHKINGEYSIKVEEKDKEGILNIENGEIISPMFDKILEIKLFNGKTYLIAEADIETGIYSLEESRFIGEKFSEIIDYIEIGGDIYIKVKEINIYGDFVGYIDLNKEKLLGDFYEEVSSIKQKNGNLYFSYSYPDGSFGVYDITNDIELKDIMLGDIPKVVSEKDVELSKGELNKVREKFKAKGLNISSGFDEIGNTKTINGKQYMPVKIGEREGIYCNTDKIIIGDLYDQLGWSKSPYGEYKNCDFNEYNSKYSFLVKKGWRYGDVDLETGEFRDRGFFNNILYSLGF